MKILYGGERYKRKRQGWFKGLTWGTQKVVALPTVEIIQELGVGDGCGLFLFGARKNIQVEISISLKCGPQVKS